MRTSGVLPLLGFLLLSCGQMQPGDEPDGGQSGGALQEQSGTRLRRVYLVADDGARAAIWFHDMKLDVDCGFQQTAMGWRCVPVGKSPTAAELPTFVGAAPRISP